MSAKDKKDSKKQWLVRQRELASESGLAIAIVDRDGLSSIAETNNNSICSVLTQTEEFTSDCEKYCGKVFSQSKKTGQPFRYKCHAGLECVAVPVQIEGRKDAAAIVGRAFTKAEDYKLATERAISGDWSRFAPSAIFENILLTGSQSVEILAKKFAELKDADVSQMSAILAPEKTSRRPAPKESDPKPAQESRETESSEKPVADTRPDTPAIDEKVKPAISLPKINEFGEQGIGSPSVPKTKDLADETIPAEEGEKKAEQRALAAEEQYEQATWRALFGDILDLSYGKACKLIVEFLKENYQIRSMAWLENHGNRLRTTLALGKLKSQKIQISVAMDDPRMRKLLRSEASIELRERNADETVESAESAESIRLFPLVVGNEIRSAIVIGDRSNDKALVESISRFCKTVGSQLEILRLREELSRRSWLDIALRKFNESLKMIDSDEFWIRLMQNTAELLRAERGSLLIYDEKSGELIVKAAIGRKADLLNKGMEDLGNRIASGVWERGEALVIRNIAKSRIKPAPAEWNYRTGSFISYPLVIGERKIGVLNIADRVDGGTYGKEEMRLLNRVVPQIAVAADRANLKSKAGEYEQLSVTDPLTGLLNRRYLEERLDEEIKRSARHGYPMSFMMIDVDDFKSYNDQFLHPEGDKALKIVGQCLRETLRGADVAARYGGEEFSILLPQTTLEEAKTIAERIRVNIETFEFPHRKVTVSIGIATLSGRINSVEKLIECADKALFKAKREGKNQVIVFRGKGSGLPASIH